MENISQLQFITRPVEGKSLSDLVAEVCRGGVDWVQLRIKGAEETELRNEATICREVTRRFGAKLIINDNPEVALEVGADGVHLGKEDLSPSEARKMLGPGMIIGGTANTFEDICRLAVEGVDYIGLGPFRFTTTKKNLSPVLGLEGYKNIIRQMKANDINIPVVAIGGIVLSDVDEIMQTEVHGIALSGVIARADEVSKAAGDFIRQIRNATLQRY